MAKLATLKDEFNNTVVKTLWAEFTGGSATLSYDATGAQVNFPAVTSADTDGDLSSATTYDLLDSYASLNVLTVSGGAFANTDNTFRLKADNNNYLQWQYEAGTLYAAKVVATSQTNVFNVTYDSVLHAWWRIREANGTTFWETSADGISWTTRYSEANPITLTAITVLIIGNCFGVDVSPGAFKWKNFNILPFLTGYYPRVKAGNGVSVVDRTK